MKHLVEDLKLWDEEEYLKDGFWDKLKRNISPDLLQSITPSDGTQVNAPSGGASQQSDSATTSSDEPQEQATAAPTGSVSGIFSITNPEQDLFSNEILYLSSIAQNSMKSVPEVRLCVV